MQVFREENNETNHAHDCTIVRRRAAVRKASCTELKEAWANTQAAERKVADEIRRSTNGTVATNVLGAAAFADRKSTRLNSSH